MGELNSTSEQASPGTRFPATLLVQVAGGVLAAFAAIVFTISFAAIAFAGEVSPFLNWGIGLVLVGTAIATVIAGTISSTRGMVAHPQDAPLLLMASATPAFLSAARSAGAMPGTKEQFATFFAFMICVTGLTGLAMFLAGRFRLSFMARYLPYPVIAGVVASMGYLLVVASVSLVVQQPVDIFSLPSAFADGGFETWMPWAAGAAALFFASRRVTAKVVLPLGLGLALLAFHLYMLATGTTFEQAEAAGLLLGPFPEGGFLAGYSPGLLLDAKWGVVFSNLTVLLAIAPLSVLTCLIHVQAVCRSTGEEPDLDRDLVANGLANIAGAGNIVSYPAVSTSLLAAEFRTGTIVACGATAALALGVAEFGAHFLGALPRGLLAMLILYLGINMVVSTLATEWRRLPARDLAPIAAILGTTMAVGLYYGLALGVALSVILFTVSYARLPFIRTETTLALRPSIVERGEPDRMALAKAGESVRILEVSGYLFFGTAHALRQRVQSLADSAAAPTKVIVLNFEAVSDIDASAISSLVLTLQEGRALGIDFYITGLPDFVAERFRRFGFGADEGSGLHVMPTLDDALQRIEDLLIAGWGKQSGAGATDSFIAELSAAFPDLDLAQSFETVCLADGATLFRQGASSTDIFVLVEGRAVAIVGEDATEPLVVARFEPGAIIGEMAFYQEEPRSATVAADGPARFLRIEASCLAPEGGLPDAVVIAFHRLAARHLSRRLDRVTKLLRQARI